MLKITRTQSGPKWMIKLEGEIRDAWIDEARRACRSDPSDGAIELNLSDVTFVDAAGRELLVDLLAQGAGLSA